jgi:hypothetical protein
MPLSFDELVAPHLVTSYAAAWSPSEPSLDESAGKMRVIRSWSGEPSRSVAKVPLDWLHMVVQHLDPWLSDEERGSDGHKSPAGTSMARGF